MRTKTRMTPLWLALTVLALSTLAFKWGESINETSAPEGSEPSLPIQEPAASIEADLTREQRSELISSTVQIAGLYVFDDELFVGYTGSGTIISKDGLILTNAHVASPPAVGDPNPPPDALGIAIVSSEDKPAEPAYFAEILVIDGYLDLAVLKITATLDGNRVDSGGLNLPYVELGDSEDIFIGDNLNVFGFPGIGGDTITYTQGIISGFASDEEIGDRSWVKTDATISGGNSGGLGADDNGHLIGVPTGIGAGTGVKGSDCRPSQDTNGDNRVDENDFCVPVSNFISELRPINLAKPLIQAARNNQSYSSPYGRAAAEGGTGTEVFGPVSWFKVTNLKQCEVEDSVASFPSGTTAIAVGNEYSGMSSGQVWAIVWSLNGEIILDSKYAWELGERGELSNCLSNIDGSPLADGEYQVALFAGPDLPLLTEGEVTVGSGNTQPAPKADIQLSGIIYDEDTNKPIPDAVVVVLNTGTIYEEWTGEVEDIFTMAYADDDGFYVLPDKLMRNTPYTVASGAEGYWDTWGDGLIWTDSDPANYVLDIGLVK